MFWRKKKKEEKKKESEVGRAVKEFFYGMSAHIAVRQMMKMRMYLEHLFMLITIGDMLGMPILPPYYSLKLLPYAIPNLQSWKRRLLRERDVTDMLY